MVLNINQIKQLREIKKDARAKRIARANIESESGANLRANKEANEKFLDMINSRYHQYALVYFGPALYSEVESKEPRDVSMVGLGLFNRYEIN